jgi:hypothetical protein
MARRTGHWSTTSDVARECFQEITLTRSCLTEAEAIANSLLRDAPSTEPSALAEYLGIDVVPVSCLNDGVLGLLFPPLRLLFSRVFEVADTAPRWTMLVPARARRSVVNLIICHECAHYLCKLHGCNDHGTVWLVTLALLVPHPTLRKAQHVRPATTNLPIVEESDVAVPDWCVLARLDMAARRRNVVRLRRARTARTQQDKIVSRTAASGASKKTRKTTSR